MKNSYMKERFFGSLCTEEKGIKCITFSLEEEDGLKKSWMNIRRNCRYKKRGY